VVGGASAGRGLGLVLDLSHAGFAAVLNTVNAEGDDVLARSARPSGTRHDDVADWTESLLREAGGTFADMAWIAVGIGPGSFTGIRIAMAFAQGIGLPHSVPLHGFTSFEALHLSFASAHSNTRNSATGSALAAIPANAGRFYVSRGLEDPGALIAGEELAALADSSLMVLAPEHTQALAANTTGFAGTWIPESGAGKAWDAVAIARHARAAGRGAERPLYLQLSAAEEKFAKDEKADL
jgi:tRNA threonylcarbamoyladenosine biosynthesis protein TsaB